MLYGNSDRNVWLYLHGQYGYKEEAERFAKLVCSQGESVLAIDLPKYGTRQSSSDPLVPWLVVPELLEFFCYAQQQWREIKLRATSLGA